MGLPHLPGFRYSQRQLPGCPVLGTHKESALKSVAPWEEAVFLALMGGFQIWEEGFLYTCYRRLLLPSTFPPGSTSLSLVNGVSTPL